MATALPLSTERRASAIAGRGLFATRAVAADTVVGLEPDPLNHSCDPTLGWLDGTRLVTLRDVAADEELTLDYATSSADPSLLVRCHCETYRCRQMVTGEDWRIPEVQRRYAGHFAAPVQRLIDAGA